MQKQQLQNTTRHFTPYKHPHFSCFFPCVFDQSPHVAIGPTEKSARLPSRRARAAAEPPVATTTHLEETRVGPRSNVELSKVIATCHGPLSGPSVRVRSDVRFFFACFLNTCWRRTRTRTHQHTLIAHVTILREHVFLPTPFVFWSSHDQFLIAFGDEASRFVTCLVLDGNVLARKIVRISLQITTKERCRRANHPFLALRLQQPR